MPRSASPYAAVIRRSPAYRVAYDARHIEAYLRLWHETLDGLEPLALHAEVAEAIRLIDVVGVSDAEALAQSFGL